MSLITDRKELVMWLTDCDEAVYGNVCGVVE